MINSSICHLIESKKTCSVNLFIQCKFCSSCSSFYFGITPARPFTGRYKSKANSWEYQDLKQAIKELRYKAIMISLSMKLTESNRRQMRVHTVHFLYSLSFIPTVKDSKWVTATNTVSCQARAGSSIPSGISKTALSNKRWDTRPTCLLFQFNTEAPVLLFRLPKSVSQKHKKGHHSEQKEW